MVKAVRGAVHVKENERDNIERWVPKLVAELLKKNNIRENDCISILFSQTSDITICNPASALRKKGFQSVPLFCTMEPEYPESLPTTIRVLITYNTETNSEPVPVYLNGAEHLRKDIFETENVKSPCEE